MKDIEFRIICNCKAQMRGIMRKDDYKDVLECFDCGLVWLIPRPYEQEETP